MWQVPGNEYFEASGDLGVKGQPKRVFFASILSEASTGAVLTLRDGTATGDSAFVTLNGSAGSGSLHDLSHTGIRFPRGCYVHAGAESGLTNAVIVFQEEQ